MFQTLGSVRASCSPLCDPIRPYRNFYLSFSMGPSISAALMLICPSVTRSRRSLLLGEGLCWLPDATATFFTFCICKTKGPWTWWDPLCVRLSDKVGSEMLLRSNYRKRYMYLYSWMATLTSSATWSKFFPFVVNLFSLHKSWQVDKPSADNFLCYIHLIKTMWTTIPWTRHLPT